MINRVPEPSQTMRVMRGLVLLPARELSDLDWARYCRRWMWIMAVGVAVNVVELALFSSWPSSGINVAGIVLCLPIALTLRRQAISWRERYFDIPWADAMIWSPSDTVKDRM